MMSVGAVRPRLPKLRLAPSPRRVFAVAASAFSLLALVRVLVLLFESYSAVRSERLADRELIAMCDAGTGAQSADFRALCLRKRAEQSAPVLFKALLRACGTAFADFCESMSSPTKVLLLILFCFTGVAAPVVKAFAALVADSVRRRRRRRRRGGGGGSKESGSDDDSSSEDEMSRIVVVAPTAGPVTRTARQRLTSTLRQGARRVVQGPSLIELETDGDDYGYPTTT